MENVFIRKMSFSGYKAFKDKVEINFITNKSKYDNTNTVTTLSGGGTKYDLNTLIGIIGPNASGKSSILDVFNLYATYIRLGFDRLIEPVGGGGPSFESYSILNNSLFNFDSKEINIELEIQNGSDEVVHNITFYFDKTFAETISIKNLGKIGERKTKKTVYTKKREDKNTQSFFEFCKFYFNPHFIKTNKNKEMNDYYLTCFNAISSIAYGILTPFSVKDFQSIFNLFDLFFNEDPHIKMSFDQKVEMLKIIASIIDPNIVDATVGQLQMGTLPIDRYKFVLQTGQEVTLKALSDGTVKMIGVLLNMVHNYFLSNSRNVYVLIDEIDNSWHPNLTKILIKMFSLPQFKGYNLICTFHNPYLSDAFRWDGLYLIDHDRKVLTWSEYRGTHNKKYPNNMIRPEHKFESKYLNEVICTGPEQMEFSKLFNYLDDVKY